MTVAVGASPLPAGERSAPAPVVGIRTASATDRRAIKLICGAVIVSILAAIFAIYVSRPRLVYTVRDQTYLGLTGRDDRTAVVLKLGEPATDHWQSDTGELQYEALAYPDRRLTVILMGSDRKSVHYIGAMDGSWEPVHSVPLRSGGSTDSLLRGLHRF